MTHGMSPWVTPHSIKSPGTLKAHDAAQIIVCRRHDSRSGEAY